jgi:hypothetical protein
MSRNGEDGRKTPFKPLVFSRDLKILNLYSRGKVILLCLTIYLISLVIVALSKTLPTRGGQLSHHVPWASVYGNPQSQLFLFFREKREVTLECPLCYVLCYVSAW